MKSISRENKLTAAAVAVILMAAFVCLASFRPRFLEGVKRVTVNVTHADGTVRTETLETNARYLAEALDPLALMELAETEEGLVPITVDGETADGVGGRYWAVLTNGTLSESGIDTLPVADGDVFDFYSVVY